MRKNPLTSKEIGKKFIIKCLSCGSSNSIQTTMEKDSGYSNWTVLDSGYIEFKCHSCGAFGSTDSTKDKPNNKLALFEVKCTSCGSSKWDYIIGDVDGEQKTHIECECGAEWEMEDA